MKLLARIKLDEVLTLETSKESVTVGRSSKSRLVIKEATISRTHCQIDYVNGLFYITDLGSTNGTFIDGVKLTPRVKTPFASSSHLRLGSVDCELLESFPSSDSSKLLPNMTNTYSRTLQVESAPKPPRLQLEKSKKEKSRRPRNPVSENFEYPQKDHLENRRLYILIFFLVAILVALLVQLGSR